jgi:hypothetical protein
MKLLKLPIQSEPVVRTITGAPVSSQNGIEASNSFFDALNTINTIGNSGIISNFGQPFYHL